MREMRYAYKILVESLKGRDQLEGAGVDRKIQVGRLYCLENSEVTEPFFTPLSA
jgi:hypothetical protein